MERPVDWPSAGRASAGGQAALLAVLVLTFTAPVRGEISDARFFGDDRPLNRQLETVLSVHWQGVALRDALLRLHQTQKIAVWLDRRSDPTVEISIDAQETPLGELLQQVAEQTGLGLTASRNLVYLGPPESAAELRTHWAIAHQQVEAMEHSRKSKMLRQSSLSVPRLTEPSEVIASLGQRMGIRIKNLDAVPYDLRPAAALPKMATVEQFTLLLLEFDLFWKPQRDGRSVRLVPVERPVVVQRGAGKETYTGPVEKHEQLRGATDQNDVSAPRRPQKGKQVYTLRVDQQPAGAILQQLSKQLQLELTIDETAEVTAALDQRITFEVREASLAKLLKVIGEAANLDIRLEKDRIRVAE